MLVYFIWQVSNPTYQSQLPHILSECVHKGKNGGLLHAHLLCMTSRVKVSSQYSGSWGYWLPTTITDNIQFQSQLGGQWRQKQERKKER